MSMERMNDADYTLKINEGNTEKRKKKVNLHCPASRYMGVTKRWQYEDKTRIIEVEIFQDLINIS